MNKRVIFLDIGGVVTSAKTGWYIFDVTTVGFLRWFCKETEAKIVISSTWRKNHDKAFFEKIFGDVIHVSWCTPDLYVWGRQETIVRG
jgi:hypothetical protein